MSIKRVAVKTIIIMSIIMLFRSMFVSPIVTKAIAGNVGQIVTVQHSEDMDTGSVRSMVQHAIMHQSAVIWSNAVIDVIILVILGSAFYQLYRLDAADEQSPQA